MSLATGVWATRLELESGGGNVEGGGEGEDSHTITCYVSPIVGVDIVILGINVS